MFKSQHHMKVLKYMSVSKKQRIRPIESDESHRSKSTWKMITPAPIFS